MIENEFMDASEKLTAFIDGELPNEEYGSLFYELAKNTELQDELSELIMIKSTFHNKLSIAPQILKNSIMDKVGLGIPTLVERLLSPTLMTTFFSGQWLRFAALSSLIMFFGIVPLNQDNTMSNRFAQQLSMVDEPISQANIPVVSSTDMSNEVQSNTKVNTLSPAKTGTLASREPIFTDRVMPLKPDDIVIELEEKSKEIFLPIENSKAHPNNYYRLSGVNGNFNKVDIQTTLLGRFLNDFSIGVKTFNGASFPNFDVSGYNEPIVNNFSIVINYKINKKHHIGLAYGQENFLMQFDQQEGEIIYTYNQSFNSNWVAGTYKYAFPQIANSGVCPEVSILVGATQVGPVVKLGSGIAYLVTDNFILNLGIEYSLLSYPTHGDWRNGQWFFTHKLGYSFGIGLNL